MAAPVGRFAPTPSGFLHLGNVFCSLLAWLESKSQNGTILLRIEDLDPQRCSLAKADALAKDLEWLGLTWDAGAYINPQQNIATALEQAPLSPAKTGLPTELPTKLPIEIAALPEAESYFQSQRSAIYAHYFQKLLQQNAAYPCFCSRNELHAANAPHASDGRLLYAGTCRNLTASEQQERAAKRSPAYRLRTNAMPITFTDGHYGSFTAVLEQDCGDFIIRRSDGVYAYQLAVVVDDALMGVNQVVRGADLLDSTPMQLYLYQLLGLKAPSFVHIPLLTAPDGRRLAKRDGALELSVLRQKYPQPEQIIGLLAYLAGQLPRPEAIKPQELLTIYDRSKLPHENIVVPQELYL